MTALPWILAGTALTNALFNRPQGAPQGTAPGATQPTSSGGGFGQTLGTVNDAVQLGALVQNLFQGESDRNLGMRNAAMANMPRPQGMSGFQPTAYDPRLQQALGRR